MSVQNTTPRSHGILNKNCRYRWEKPPYKLLVTGFSGVHKTRLLILLLVIQLKGKMLLLKTPHPLASKDREINFKPPWNLPHC